MKVVREIARGGFGVVEEVETPSGQRVARKTFSPNPNLGPLDIDKLRKRFRREVGIHKQLAKYGAVPILEADLSVDPPWFTMPLAERNYREQIDDDRKAGVISAEALADILTCLEEVHQRGIVHRDLKPENILKVAGRWCLADFGLSIQPDSGVTTKLTTTGSAYGSAAYTAPEQLKDFSKAKAAADIYSFGCILHDLVDGGYRAPFATATTKGQWDGVIRKCTAADPSKRFKSIKTLREVLHHTVTKHGTLKPRAEVVAWKAELGAIPSWETEKFLQLSTVVEGEVAGDESGVLAELTEEYLSAIHAADVDCWSRIAKAYAAWAGASFTWSLCDVMADRVMAILADVGADDLELRAELVLGLARLATINHRFFVMKRVIVACGPNLDDDTAERIAIEFRAGDEEHLLNDCLRELWHYTKRDLHPVLQELIP